MPPDNRGPRAITSGAAARKEELHRHAEQHLRTAGLQILDRNWRSAGATIDIVATEHRILVACTVRVSSRPTPAAGLSRAQRARLQRAGISWLTAHGLLFDEIRVDTIGIHRGPGGTLVITHTRGGG